MKTNDIVKSVGLTFNKIGFKIQKKSPELLIVAGVIGVVASTVMACKATTKAGKVADEAKEAIDDIHEAEERGTTNAGETYSKNDVKKDLAIVYRDTGINFVKLYGPAVITGAASIACIVTSHHIMKKRSVALAAAYTALDKSYKDYRGRVLERFGEQVEKELYHGIKAKEIKEKVVDENGKEQKVKQTVDVAPEGWDPSMLSPYSRIFDETNPHWNRDAEMNRFFLTAQQNYATDMLRARGHLFLNEVYDMLGFPRTGTGAVVGWLYDPKNPELGDTYVDFGMFDVRREKAVDFVNAYEKSIILDFNVVGDIRNELATHQNL